MEAAGQKKKKEWRSQHFSLTRDAFQFMLGNPKARQGIFNPFSRFWVCSGISSQKDAPKTHSKKAWTISANLGYL